MSTTTEDTIQALQWKIDMLEAHKDQYPNLRYNNTSAGSHWLYNQLKLLEGSYNSTDIRVVVDPDNVHRAERMDCFGNRRNARVIGLVEFSQRTKYSVRRIPVEVFRIDNFELVIFDRAWKLIESHLECLPPKLWEAVVEFAGELRREIAREKRRKRQELMLELERLGL
jgi:hypothetical protein